MKILLGITGSVAATISHKIVKAMEEVEGCEKVSVVMTESARRFMPSYKLKSLTRVDVYTDSDEWSWKGEDGAKTDLWQKDYPILHIELAKEYDVFVIAPATANTVAKLNHGICDNLLTSVYAAWRVKNISALGETNNVIIAPSMNTYMLLSHSTTKNIQELSCINTIVSPQRKRLACGDYGYGAMAEIEKIVEGVNNLNKSTKIYR